MESSQADTFAEYRNNVTECMDKILKLAPRKCDALKKEAKRAIGKHSSPFYMLPLLVRN